MKPNISNATFVYKGDSCGDILANVDTPLDTFILAKVEHFSPKETKRVGTLLAAAPLMLQALEYAENVFTMDYEQCIKQDALRHMRNAIDKATE